MDLIHHLGSLALGSRLKRLSDRFMVEAAAIYAEQDASFEPRWFPLYSVLRETGPMTTGEAAKALRLSHAAVSQIARDMVTRGAATATKDKIDERKTRLALTAKGKDLAAKLEPLWKDMRAAVDEITAETGIDVISALSRLERVLDERSIAERMKDRRTTRELATVRIVDFIRESKAGQRRLKDAFSALNLAWIERYFAVEPSDVEMLSDPARTIVADGGHVLFAELDGEIVGCVALIARGAHAFELAKMAVDPKAQGRHIGKKLMEAAIARATAAGATSIHLETNDSLTPAVNLYRRCGFVPDPARAGSKYKRVNLFMSLELV